MRDFSFKGMHPTSLQAFLRTSVLHISSYTILAGWGIMVCPPTVHLNPTRYKNPLDFNPWRWEV
ncbi:Cytochrome P450 87A3 [Bienertia sinuspersici]